MSEHQYYEFLAVDRALTAAQQDELRSLSSRADITAWRFENTYNYGDLRGDPRSMLAKYFDAFVYVANWGTRRLAFRLPRGLLPKDALSFARAGALSVWTAGEHAFVEWESQEEDGGGWEEGEGWMSALLGLRKELISGDLRPLFLGWLAGLAEAVEMEDVEPEDPAPAPPTGLGALTAAQEALLEFLRIDSELVRAAAEDAPPPEEEPDWDDLATAMTSLPEEEKDLWLMRLFEGEDPHLSERFVQRLRQDIPRLAPAPGRARAARTVGELLERAQGRAADQEQARFEAAQRQRDAELDALEGREEPAWKKVSLLIERKQVQAYDEAVAQLCDLRELAARRGESAAFDARLRALLTSLGRRRPALDERVQKARLLEKMPAKASPREEELRRDVAQFDEDSRAGEYYESFNVNSKNFMQKSEGTKRWIAECNALLSRCVAAASAGSGEIVREAFETIFDLLAILSDGSDEIIFFADEAGAWQVGVDWERVMPAWLSCLARTADPAGFAEQALWIIDKFEQYNREKHLQEARRVANDAQREALQTRLAATPSQRR